MTDPLLLWVDFESTGLNPEMDVPIEVYAQLTSWDLDFISDFHAFYDQGPLRSLCDSCDSKALSLHEQSGLFEDYLTAQPAYSYKVDEDFEEWFDRFAGDKTVHLAGSSLYLDKTFLRLYHPGLHSRLHHVLLDVSGLQFALGYNDVLKRRSRHRAEDDVRDAIERYRILRGLTS